MTAPLISVVLPCYFKFYDWVTAAEHNSLYCDPRVEIVLSLDEPSEAKLFERYCVHNSTRMKLRLLVTREQHPWRPPCKAINAGIVRSRGKFIIVMSPETILLTLSPEYLFRLIDSLRGRFFVTGALHHIKPHELRSGDLCNSLFYRIRTNDCGHGFILFSREDALAIGGYDESRLDYGGDDDCFRHRLLASGVVHQNDTAIRVAHIWRDTRPTHDGIWKRFRSLNEVSMQRLKPRVRVAWDWEAA